MSYVFLDVFVGDVTSLEKFIERHDVMMLKMKATIILLIIAATMGKPIPIGLFLCLMWNYTAVCSWSSAEVGNFINIIYIEYRTVRF